MGFICIGDGSMEVRQLQIFRILAEELNFTRTAERVHTVQSNVTTQIKALEEEPGTPRYADRCRAALSAVCRAGSDGDGTRPACDSDGCRAQRPAAYWSAGER